MAHIMRVHKSRSHDSTCIILLQKMRNTKIFCYCPHIWHKSNSLCRSDFDPPHLEHTDGLLSFQFFPNTMQKVFRYDIDGGRVMSFTGRSMQIMHHHDLTVHVLHRTHPSPCTYEKQHVPMSRSRCTCELVSRPNKFWHSSNVYNNSYYYYYYYTINWAGHVAHMDIRKYKTWDIKY